MLNARRVKTSAAKPDLQLQDGDTFMDSVGKYTISFPVGTDRLVHCGCPPEAGLCSTSSGRLL